jgi:hypothetical protein
MRGDDMAWTTKPEFSLTHDTTPIVNIGVAIEEIRKHSNLKPTHDPYTNPDSHIYYECNCGAILDPGTRSFAQLNNVASAKDWKVRWRKDGQGYEAFCVECGKDKE